MSEAIDLHNLGWTASRASHWQDIYGPRCATREALHPARVVSQHRGGLRLLTEDGLYEAEISGRLRYTAADPTELPAVGDWVAATLRCDERTATVHDVLPRGHALVRGAPADRSQAAQVLAANVDTVWIVTSLNRDFNPRRIERTLALVRESGARGVVMLTKGDLVDDPAPWVYRVMQCAPDVPVHVISAQAGLGLDPLRADLRASETVALVGSSGVGKSTLVNRLVGRDVLATSETRADDDRGRHTTTHRELVPIPDAGSVIDTPGLRELALWSDEAGSIDSAFSDLEALFARCRFHDCGHGDEPGCAVREAIERGALDPARLASHRKLKREAERMERRRNAKGRHEERKKHKQFAKMLKTRVDKRDRR